MPLIKKKSHVAVGRISCSMLTPVAHYFESVLTCLQVSHVEMCFATLAQKFCSATIWVDKTCLNIPMCLSSGDRIESC